MPTTTVSALERTAQKTQAWLEELAIEGKLTDAEQAYSAMRAALHAIRDRLTVDEATDLASELPMMVRGFYYEGWRPSLAPNTERSSEEFLEHVASSLRDNQTIDPAHAVRSVLALLQRKISDGEMADIRQMLPNELVEQFWPTAQ
jgi:uncharacterized protein (DUF2267 family)